MSHEIESAFYAKEPAWHGLGTIVSETKNSKEAIILAGLNWKVETQPIYLKNKIEIPDKKAIVRTSDNSVFDVVSNIYKVVQNEEAFSFIDELLENNIEEIKYESAGSLKGGRVIWLLAHLPKRVILGDDFIPYICFSTSHDRTMANSISMTPTRVVCWNTLTAALRESKRNWSFKHTGNIQEKKKEAARTLKLSVSYLNEFEEFAEQWQQKKITKEGLNEVINYCFPITEDMSKAKIYNTSLLKNTFIDLYTNTEDLKKFKGSAWGVYNAFSDIASHRKPIRKTESFAEKLFAGFIGTGDSLLTKAQHIIEQVIQ